MAPNLLNKCSVCFKVSSTSLSPLFYKTGEQWNKTFVTHAFEQIFNKIISSQNASELFACGLCTNKLSQYFFNYPMNPIEFSQANIHNFLDIEPSKSKESWMIIMDTLKPERKINQLEEKLLIKIFSYFSTSEWPKLSLVCYDWKKILERTRFYGKSFVKINSPTYYDFVQLANNCGKSLKILSINNINLDTMLELKLIGQQCKQLHKLSLLLPNNVDDDILKYAFCYMFNLKNIEFYLLPDRTAKINLNKLFYSLNRDIIRIGFICKNESLDFIWYHDPYFYNFGSALYKFYRLRHILFKNIAVCENLMNTITNIETLHSISLEGLERKNNIKTWIYFELPTVKNFKVTFSRQLEFLFKKILNYCTNLHSLVMTDCAIRLFKNFFDDNLKNNCIKTLVELEISRCIGHVEILINTIPQFVNLKYLKIHHMPIDDKTLTDILKNCLLLVKLYLEECFIDKAKSFVGLRNLKKLECLNLANIIFKESIGLNNVLENVTYHCWRLKKIILCDSPTIRSTTFMNFAAFKHLEVLSIQFIDGFNDRVLQLISRNLRNLRKINCKCCFFITDISAKDVITNCKFLNYFNVASTEVTIDTIIHAKKEKIKYRRNNIVLNLHVSSTLIHFRNILDENTCLLDVQFE